MACKRKTLCIEQKVALIRAIEKGKNKSDVARHFGLNVSTVSTIWKAKEKILEVKMAGRNCNKIRKPKYQDLDRIVSSWVHKQHSNNVPLSGPIIKATAEKFAKQLNISGFKASEGWLGKFKQRHKINYKQISEAQNVNTNVIDLDNMSPKPKQIKEEEDPLDDPDQASEAQDVDPNVTNLDKASPKPEPEEDLSDEPEPAPPTIDQALDAVKLLEKFLLSIKNQTRHLSEH